MSDDIRCEDCCREIGTTLQPQYKVPAWICETLLNRRIGGTPYTVSGPTADWLLCRDCCGTILLGAEPGYMPLDRNMFGPPGI